MRCARRAVRAFRLLSNRLVICSLFCCTACGCCSLADLMPLGQATDKGAAVMQLMAGNAPCGTCIVGTAGDSAKVFECADAAAKPILLAGSSAAASDASPGDFQSTFDRCTPGDPYVCTTIGASNLTFRCRVSGPETGHPSGSGQGLLRRCISSPACPFLR